MPYHVVVKFNVMPEKRAAFQAACKINASMSLLKETGTLRFEVIRDEADGSVFYIDELYSTKDSFKVHCNGENFRNFIEATKDYASAPVIIAS